MPGGLLNIAAYGAENLILTGNPKKTFFKVKEQFRNGVYPLEVYACYLQLQNTKQNEHLKITTT